MLSFVSASAARWELGHHLMKKRSVERKALPMVAHATLFRDSTGVCMEVDSSNVTFESVTKLALWNNRFRSTVFGNTTA